MELWCGERIALDWEEEKKKSQNNFLESHVWSQISGKPVEKNLEFFESRLEFLYFELKNGSRGLNRLGVKKIFRDPSRSSTEVNLISSTT